MSYCALAPACILPTPLEQQKQSTEFPPPQILVDETAPQIGRLSLSSLDPVSIAPVAEDIDPNQMQLFARLYVQLPGQMDLAPSAVSAIELTRLTDTPTKKFRFGMQVFSASRFCTMEPAGTLLWLFVGTGPLNDDPKQIMVPVDKQHWELQCTQ